MAVKNQMCFVEGIESFIAGAAISKYDTVKADSTEGQVVHTVAPVETGGFVGDVIIGFALEAATAGQPVSVQTKGVARARASDAILLGASVQGTDDGEVVTVGTTANKLYRCIGQAASAAAAADEIISVVINRHETYTHSA